jgi:threonyl-tRNA synthetase
MIHRAPFGSMERFCGVLIEHFGGHFPAWLAPEQCRIMTISDKQNDYAQQVAKQLKAEGFRVTVDDSSDKIGGKIRRGQVDRVPYLLVAGGKEQEAGAVAVRARGKDEGAQPVAQFIERLKDRVNTRSLEF